VSFDDEAVRSAAKNDPVGFVHGLPARTILVLLRVPPKRLHSGSLACCVPFVITSALCYLVTSKLTRLGIHQLAVDSVTTTANVTMGRDEKGPAILAMHLIVEAAASCEWCLGDPLTVFGFRCCRQEIRNFAVAFSSRVLVAGLAAMFQQARTR
jgi:hypothetical protein